MSTERFKNVTSFVINLLNNKTIILLNLAEYRLILASSAKYQTIFRAISQDKSEIKPENGGINPYTSRGP